MTSLHVCDSCNREGDQYPEFRSLIEQRFSALVGNGLPLFTTDAENLFDVFLANLPDEARQHYTCHACKEFVNRFGGLVSITEKGETVPAMWAATTVPDFFKPAVAALERAVLKAKVTGVFVSDKPVLGTPVTGAWEHLFVKLPQGMVHRDRLKTAGQAAAEKLEEYRMLSSALADYPANVIDQAQTLINSDILYRGDKVKGNAEWLKALKDRVEGTKGSGRRANLRWLAVATAPAGFCHFRGGMLGTLLDDIKEGKSTEAIVRNFREKMDPLQYQRPQAAPAQGNIEQAEKIVEKLGIAASLKRRFARFDEIPQFLWKPSAPKDEAQNAGSVFGHLKAKGAATTNDTTVNLPSAVMTWEKFKRTVLPEALAIDAMVEGTGRFMAMVTAVDPEAPNIFRWDNTFSWYFRRNGTHANWGVPLNGFVKVKGIIDTPNLWGEKPVTHAGQQVFFLLEGCRDMVGATGGGFFPEMLKSDLHEVRSTLEAYANTATLEGADTADACGAGFSKEQEWNITLKVTTANSSQVIKIDRWD